MRHSGTHNHDTRSRPLTQAIHFALTGQAAATYVWEASDGRLLAS